MTSSKDTTADETADALPTFAELGLAPKILKALDDLGYTHPTPIQAQAIPPALQGQDILGIAQTGTGKTAAFTLPTIHKLSKGRARARMPRCLIICPTRELAAQVAENVELYGKHLRLEMALIIGGVSFGAQEKKLMKGVDVLIATPGRLLDQFERGKILLTGVQTLVVDEADRMLDMGFIPDIEQIFKLTPFTRQVLFFSATMPDEIKRIVDQFMHQPVTIEVARQSTTAATVTQKIIKLPSSDAKQKRAALRWVIDNETVQNGIVFCNRKRDVDIVAKSLNTHGHKAAPIHGDLPQSVRTKTLEDFKTGSVQLLVASDVAARGLDIPDVSHVFNYDVPSHAEDYVHRIGRTGRAGREGDAIMFVTRLDDKYYSNILSLIKSEGITEMTIPDFDSFPKEQKRRGRSSKSTNKKSGWTRKPDGSRSSTQSSAGKQSETTHPEPKNSKPKKADSRRAAPPRKGSSRTRDDNHQDRDTEKASANKDTSSKRSDDTSNKPKKQRRSRSQGSDKSAANKSGSQKGKDQTKTASNVVGFGDDVPAFLKVSSKD